ncbi:hypothetical protein HU200_018031 [Digitaria exilis]|uniref:ARM repeat superfamily protein n=1 Tax=Digitaria exilis TaxID=1010633 RepID=A0A835F588_9POAL|nr:hypothetical protein HU200_018031 [Digitaria exilis]
MKYTNGRESNGDRSRKGGGGDVPPPSIQIDMSMVRRRGGGGGSSSFFEPWTPTPGSGSVVVRGGGSSGSSGDPTPHHPSGGGGREPPEKLLTLFALRLAVLEKAASGLGTLNFVWATVVLLGGFVSNLTLTDFWCITVILVGEGARVFGRSHELEWQHHATETSSTAAAAGVLRSSSRFFRRVLHFHAAVSDDGGAAAGEARANTKSSQVQRQLAAVAKQQRGWHAPDVSLLPYTSWVSAARNIGWLLHWLQVISAVSCVALSLMRLWKHDFFAGGSKNMRPALLLFYTLALLEASLFLLERAYWAWQFDRCKLLHKVADDCHLGACGPIAIRRFFYDAYSKCIDGSIFDGIKMDLVTFAEDLILSDFLDEQLIGVRILEQFATNAAASTGDTLRKIGTSPQSVERLVEMLSWKRRYEEDLRRSAAEVVCKLAGKRQNALRLSGIPGAIESVASLLYTGRGVAVSGMHPQPNAAAGGEDDDYLAFNLLGLRILKKLARDQDNCGKIENARGLLSKIIDFTKTLPNLLQNRHASDSQVRAVKHALQVVKRLVSTTGNTGEALRRGVAANVFAVCSLRGILRYGQLHRELQKLAIDVLAALAMDDTGKEAIMATGGLVKLLLSTFAGVEEEGEIGCNAGKALAMLALESEKGCAAILKQRADVVDLLVSALQDDGSDDRRRLNAARVLRSLCAYSGPKHRERLRVATKALPLVLRITMKENKELDNKVLEVCVGLTTQICRFIDGERFADELRAAGVEERAYVQRLARILRDYKYPEIRVPRMRRFVVQQVVWMMTCSRGDVYVELLREVGMEGLLGSIADTTSELECYHAFSGSVGIGKHRESFSGVVDIALELITAVGRAAPAHKGERLKGNYQTGGTEHLLTPKRNYYVGNSE